MWPWEHAAVGYVIYSLAVRLVGRRPPTDLAVIALLAGSQLPDLIDKPLAWWLHVLPAGRSLGHSLPFAVPLIASVLIATRAIDRGESGVAFAIGYLSHLPGDVFYPVLLGDAPALAFLLYPFVEIPPGARSGAIAKLGDLLVGFGAFLATPRGTLYLAAEGLLLGLAVSLWVWDGRPGLGLCPRRVRRAITG
ncbi:LexA-binding, inner membrane-associated putative hydrolase [Halorientalis persicus]|uniref:LexA-binding, inner membrane-associated putative hydrolase n=1 Tax=Halorientalis persicus TaxID=1367881 RepID=A0A1H8SKM7_9EURY|nr:metal-dependent hydrolase [Halorientalis persicus]SEO79125.1 LexA-binding, inner membrane-associated putative hydrolase [Halorientalis persicus]